MGAASPSFVERLGYGLAWHEIQETSLEPWRELLPHGWDREAVRCRLLDCLDVPGQITGRPVLHQSLYLYAQAVLPGHVLTVMGDRMEMAHSIKARLPFLDHHVEFSRTVPFSQKVRGFAEKFLLRKALHLVVPPAVCGRRKKPLQTTSYWQTAGPLRDLLEDTVRGQALECVPFLEKLAVLRCLDRLRTADLATRALLETPLMTLLTACLLGRRFHLS